MTRTREQSLAALKAFRDAQDDWDLQAGYIDEESGLTVADLDLAIQALEVSSQAITGQTLHPRGH